MVARRSLTGPAVRSKFQRECVVIRNAGKGGTPHRKKARDVVGSMDNKFVQLVGEQTCCTVRRPKLANAWPVSVQASWLEELGTTRSSLHSCDGLKA